MKLIVEVDGSDCSLELTRKAESSELEYVLSGSTEAAGKASVVAVMPGVFSVLIGNRSFLVRAVQAAGEAVEVWTGSARRAVAIADARDRVNRHAKSSEGPQEIRAQMPGKVIQLLVGAGDTVEAGQGVIIVEAMKMQNEMKSPKAGRVARISAAEGATVTAGQSLMLIE